MIVIKISIIIYFIIDIFNFTLFVEVDIIWKG